MLLQVLLQQGVAATKFAHHPGSVHDGHNGVQLCHHREIPFLRLPGSQHFLIALRRSRKGVDSLGNGLGLADAAGFNQDVVEFPLLGEADDLLHQVGFQGAADAAVLEGNDAVLVLLHNAGSLFNEGGVDVHLANVVDDDGHLVAGLIVQYVVHQGCLARSQIAGEQGDRNTIVFHAIIIVKNWQVGNGVGNSLGGQEKNSVYLIYGRNREYNARGTAANPILA